jgi:hypothetical protein
MRKLNLIALTLALGSLLACDGAPPQTQDSEPVTPAAQAAAPEVDATESASSTPEPYDRLELLAERLQQDYLDQLNGQLGDGRPGFSMPDVVLPLEYRAPAVPNGFFEQFERGLPLRENWMNCSRYMTNNAAADFCEDEPPATWHPFEFNDETYYFVPLGHSV